LPPHIRAENPFESQIKDILPGGDHDIFRGEIEAGDSREGRPLLFSAGR
jgi:hypothetical protein